MVTMLNILQTMKLMTFLIAVLSIISCQNYHYLSEEEMEGMRYESNNHVYKLNIKIQALAECNSELTINLNNTEKYSFPFNSSLDTILSRDWYNEPLYVKVDYDSCVMDTPKVGILLVE